MYYTPDSSERKRNNVILVVLLLLFTLVFVISGFSQNYVVNNYYGNAKTYSLKDPVKMSFEKNDSIVIDMAFTLFKGSDSAKMTIVIDFPEKLYGKRDSVFFVFENGRGFNLSPTGQSHRRVYYELNSDQSSKMCWWPVKGFVVGGIADDFAINISRRKTAFNDLIQEVPRD